MQTELEIDLKQSDLLHSLLRELQKSFMRGTFATAGFILVGIGWLVTAKDSAPFLKDYPHFAWIVALAPILGAVLYCYAAWLVHRRSQNTVAALRRFDIMPSEIYESTIVSRGQFFIFSGGIVLLSMILGGCIYFAAHSSPDEDETDEDETFMQVALPHTEIQLIQPHSQFSIFSPNIRLFDPLT
ncbi:hypothetical protein [Edaphobacter aggregans]|uniref:hypothetical protein n=1 Tax=Edaphobacter aggregans TaxID=570835 RepID=UPI0005569594|nr:hypothetical protein [Edaphobacter aggregans]